MSGNIPNVKQCLIESRIQKQLHFKALIIVIWKISHLEHFGLLTPETSGCLLLLQQKYTKLDRHSITVSPLC